jgi:DNA-directed RNA polymerase specialized sigma24 family protein
MSDYEAYVRMHLVDCYRVARSVLESDEEAALAAQIMCLRAYRARAEEREDVGW